MGGKAWVTLATNDSYSLGALVLAHSLKQVGSQYDLVVLVTPGVTGTMRQKLASIFNLVQGVNILDSKDEANLRLLKRPELGVTFTKLHCWRLTQYEKCVFLDADTMVLQNCDELFEREELSAAPDVGWPDCFNSGVFVYRPSLETYEKLIQFALEKGSFDGGDQGLLNLYFSDWAHKDISKHLPFIYNMCSTACYSYLPAYKQFGSDAKIVHFIGYTKPWLQYFDSESRTVRPSGAVEHLTNVLQRWWDIFCSFIHQSLSQDMGGLAGAFARMTLGAPKSPEQIALEDSLRRQGWEVGNIDYLGRDSFDNIWSKICETLSASQPETPKQELAPAETDSQTPKVPPVEASTKSDVQEPQSPVIPLPSPDAKVQATEEDASKIAPSQQVLEQPIQPIDEAVKVPEACPLPKSADEKCSLEKPTTELPIEEKSISECPETTKIESESKPLEGAEVQVTSVTEIKGQEPAVLQPSGAEQISASVEVDTKDKTSTDISLPVQTDQAACQLTQASPTQPQSSETLPATPTTETSAPQIPSTPPTTTPSQTPTTPPAAAPVTPPTTPSQTPVTPPATIPATSPTKTPPDAPAAKPETAPTPETPAAVIEQPQTPVVESQEPLSIVQETSAQPQSPQSTPEAAKVIVPPTESAPKETPTAEPAPPSIKPEEKIQTAEKPKVEEKVKKPEEKEAKVEIAQEAVEAVKLDEQSKPEEKGKIIKTEGAVKPEGKTTSEEKAQEVTKSDEKCVKPEEKTIKLEEDKSDKSEAKPEETSTKTKDKAAEAEDKAAKVEDKAAKVEDKAPKPEAKAAKAEDKAANAEDKTVKTEDKAANAQDKAAKAEEKSAKVEEKAGKTEDKAVKAEGKAAKTDDKAAKAEGKTSKPDDKQGKSEEKAATSEGAAPSAAAATPTPPPRKGSGGNKKTGKSKK